VDKSGTSNTIIYMFFVWAHCVYVALTSGVENSESQSGLMRERKPLMKAAV